MSCLYGIEQPCSECRMCNQKEEQAGTETAKERKGDLLKKCPFCGDKAITFHIPQNDEKEMKQHPKWKWNHPGMWVIGCNTEMCMGNINHFSMVFVDERSAIETWNRRCQ